MTQNLLISGKEYLSSADIAQSFGYTPDYVSRLARERKIVATNINRKWFVCEDSFREFVRNADVDKEARSEELKKQRRVDRMMHAQELKEVALKNKSQSYVALAESFAVLLCGAFVGLLGWSVTGAGVTLSDLSSGLQESYVLIADALHPKQNPFTTFSDWSAVASVQESLVHENNSTQEVVKKTALEETKQNHAAAEHSDPPRFSDEVDVRFIEDSSGVVRPVFKSEVDGQEYQMMLAPIEEGN